MTVGIRTRLTAAVLGLALAPVLVVGGIFIVQSYRVQTQEAILLQREMASHVSSRVDSIFRELERGALLLMRVENLLDLEPERQALVLSIFHSRQSVIDDLALLDSEGRVLSYHSRLKMRHDSPLQLPGTLEPLLAPASRAETFYGPLRVDAVSGEPLMLMVVPVVALDTGKPEGMLAVDVRLKEIWDLVASIRPGQEGTSYMLDAEARVIAHSNPSVVLRGTRFDPPRLDGVQTGLSGKESVLVSRVMSIGAQQFRIVVEDPVSEALSLARDTARIVVIVVASVLLVAGAMGLQMATRIVTPIEHIAESARAINAGDLSRRVVVENRDELGVLAAAFNGMASQVESLVNDLEGRVAERTTKLAAANRELEAFSYSVSHDLRAPLRHIDGYVNLLTERCRATLSDQGVHYLDTIARSARRMGELVDDLLQFSRTGRAELRRESVEMNRVLQEALLLLRESCDGRAVEWVIAELPPVRGDRALLRQVWANLLGNAVKYTRTRETARIEVSCREEGGEVVFVVADNGVGFDMRHADKLFGVFQRLHREEEFEGTGIGLAIVQRIVSRHGGRVWAEAGPDSGARFYFALPTSEGG